MLCDMDTDHHLGQNRALLRGLAGSAGSPGSRPGGLTGSQPTDTSCNLELTLRVISPTGQGEIMTLLEKERL